MPIVTSNDLIEVPILTRVEGEGGVTIRLRDGAIDNVKLNIYEPPRLFEALLRGRPLEETPDITARICGICPVAYQMSSVHALEAALGIQITPKIRRLRRLLYCGEWIESHALQIHLLHAPHFEWGVQAATEATRWAATFYFPDFEQPYEYVSLTHPDEYPMNEGEIVSSTGLKIPVTEYDQNFVEEHVAHSTALHAVRRKERTSYFLGPLARINHNRDRLSPTARRLADEVGLAADCRNPFKNIIARCLELVHAYEEALSILREYNSAGIAHVDYQHQDGSGCAATEAPRGILFHEYRVDQAGRIVSGRIIPPTSQNQRQIEHDLVQHLTSRLQAGATRDELAIDCERLVRTYDLCISCSTHFLKVRWEESS